MKTCYFCRGDVERAVIDYMAHIPEGYFLVRNLPVDRCTQCHEVYLDPPAARAVDEARKQRAFATETISIPVLFCTEPLLDETLRAG